MPTQNSFHERMRAVFGGRRVGIWGFRDEGVAALSFLQQFRPASVTIVDDKALGPRWADLQHFDGASIVGPFEGPDASVHLLDCDVVIKSAGVSRYSEAARTIAQQGVPLLGGTQILFEAVGPERLIAVTGTKGKSTTTTAIHRILHHAGRDATLLGNMGIPVLAEVDALAHSASLCVLEVSSYQAADVSLGPSRGCLTSLHQDHLDWHHTLEAYVGDKLNLFAHGGTATELHVSPQVADRADVQALGTQLVRYGDDGQARVTGDLLQLDGHTVTSQQQLQIRGDHNLLNLCGAMSVAASIIGADGEARSAIAGALETMPALRDRMETIATFGGRTYALDVLATIPEATMAAIRAFGPQPVVLIAGGHDRGQQYRSLADEILRCPWVCAVVAVPETGRRLLDEIRHQARHTSDAHHVELVEADDLDEAVVVATALAPETATVLLSPAAASFNRYLHYRELSEHFRTIVQRLERQDGQA